MYTLFGMGQRGRSVFCTRLRVTPLTSWTVRERAKPQGWMDVNQWRTDENANRRRSSGARLHWRIRLAESAPLGLDLSCGLPVMASNLGLEFGVGFGERMGSLDRKAPWAWILLKISHEHWASRRIFGLTVINIKNKIKK